MSAEASTPNRSPFWWIRWVPLVLLLVALVVLTIHIGQSVLVPLLVSFALTMMIEPIVEWYERHGLSRNPAVLMGMGSTLAVIILVLLFLVPSVWAQLGESVDKAPEALRAISGRVHDVIEYAKTHLSSEVLHKLEDSVEGFKNDPGAITSRVGAWLTSGLFGLVNLGSTALGLLIVPFFVYYLLLDWKRLREGIDQRFPDRYRPAGTALLDEIGNVIRGYVQGRVLVALGMSIIYGFGLFLLGVPLWAGIGLIAGLIGIIPYLGVLSGLTLALAFAALNGAGLIKLASVVGVFIVAQLIEDYILTPRLIGDRLELHPMIVFIALIVAGDLFGLLGLVLAIPVVAVIKVIVQFADELYLRSDFYRGGEDVGDSEFVALTHEAAEAVSAEPDDDDDEVPSDMLPDAVGSE